MLPLLLLAWAEPTARFASAEQSRAAYEKAVAPFFKKHCAACHGPKKAEGELDVLALDPDMKASTSAGRWALLLDKIVTGEMPPATRPRPTDDERRAIAEWVRAELKRAGKNAARREAGGNGNLVPHAVLFDPRNADSVPDAPGRLRRLSPEIYAAYLADTARGLSGVGNPFSPEGKSIFKDTGAPRIDEPVTSQLIRNAVAIASRLKSREIEALLDEKKPLAEPAIAAAIQPQFRRLLGRPATPDEVTRFTALMKKISDEAGRPRGVRHALAAIMLLPEAVYRWETGEGRADERGLARLSPRAIAFGLAYSVGDRRPTDSLLAAKLNTPEEVAAATRRMLDDPKIPRPRLLRFFREYFGYEAAREVFKNDKDNPEHDARTLVEDTDRLVEWILEADKDVLKELLTTSKSFVSYKTATATRRKRAEALAKFEAQKKANPDKLKNKQPPRIGRSVYESYNLADFPDRQPVELPKEQRAGILTQPAWLVAFSTSDDNHAILRGKWVRERLLGGVVPDIPITVDAQLPQTPEKTLRERMAVTQQAYCWKCHQKMNDLGYPFEVFDHFGRFRKDEKVLDIEATKKNVASKSKPSGPVLKGVPVDSSGLVAHVGVKEVEGKVHDAVSLMRRLAGSTHVEQVFVRHAFRFFLGRDETPGDAATLQRAHKAYRDSGGSFKALVVSLLSSDSFLYRVPARPEK